MTRLFISHSSKDDDFVRELQQMLADHGHAGWIDSRELRGGDPLWPEVQAAIDGASAFAVVVSTDALQSKWVGRELQHALTLRAQRGKQAFPVIPISLDGTQLGVMETLFGDEPIYLPASSAAGGVEALMDALLSATGQRHHADVAAQPQPQAEPLEELVLELSDLKFSEKDGVRRATARARLVYEPASPGQREVASPQSWRFVAPIGPIEAEALRWYLEKFATWPNEVFRQRARQVEADLVTWGRALHDAALPAAHRENVLQAWAKVGAQAGRRFSVHVDASLEAGAPEAEVNNAREAATLLLGLPWELLHDGSAFLFQAARPTRVRRRLPNTRVLDLPVVATPIRILLVSARPEDEACGYIDHRASALPLVEAMDALGNQVRLHILNPPTLAALGEELQRAVEAGKPYQVLHFDGHGVYDKRAGLGGLCFEDPQDSAKLAQRRHSTVYTPELGALLRRHRVPLVFLEACQTAMAEQASESVATTLLSEGVASVVAMSHSVLVVTARLFVQAFYQALAQGKRVGDAMLAGQRRLKDDSFRGRVFGEGELRLADWFVPVLFQEKDDPQLFRATPSQQTQADYQTALARRVGHLPAVPATGFVGRSRELLALQRLLVTAPYAVLRGQGGEGKTALAAEFARWMLRSHQVQRAAFVSVETHGNARAVVDALGQQLVQADFSAAGDLAVAIQQVERALREQATLVVVDNLESILLPPYLDTPVALTEEAGRELAAILALCQSLLQQGQTRMVFTSREALPAPFDAPRNLRELHRLDRDDAVKLVERALDAGDGAGAALDAEREAIEALVDAVHGHARTLALLAPELRSRGVAATHAALVDLMAAMEQRFPGSREKSLFASVALSLGRLSPANRDRVRVLAVFHGAVDLDVLAMMMDWDKADVAALAGELIAIGLATADRYDHLTLNAALCPCLRGQVDAGELEVWTSRWVEAMGKYATFLVQQQSQNIDVAATLTPLELPNLFALLDSVQRAGDAEATIALATSLYSPLQNLGKPRMLERVGQVRDAAAAALGEAWSHAQFDAQLNRNQQLLDGGQLREAFEGGQALLQRAREAGDQAYPGADYDLARMCFRLARVLKTGGASELALPLLDEARQRFEAVAKARASKAAESMASACITEQADCFRDLGRLDEAGEAYEEALRRDEQRGADRDVAVGNGQLGTVRMLQHRYPEALAAYAKARKRFTQLDEPGSIAVIWHQTGMAYQDAGQPEAAEDAYRKSLAIKVQLDDVAGQAGTLIQLGNLYGDVLGRSEEAVAFYHQAADKYVANGDSASEGLTRNNLGESLRKLRRFEEARQEIHRAIECKAQYGHASAPWNTWAVLAGIETEAGNPTAAVEAQRKAVASYQAYRRDGGENHYSDGRISLAVTQALLAGEPAQAASLLQQRAANPDAAWLLPFIQALQAIVGGSRDPSLADAPGLHFTMAAEIGWLIETLEKAGR